MGQACKSLKISEQTSYRWRREYGGMDITQARKPKEMEKENARLKKPLAALFFNQDLSQVPIRHFHYSE